MEIADEASVIGNLVKPLGRVSKDGIARGPMIRDDAPDSASALPGERFLIMRILYPLHPAPFRDEQRGGLGRFSQRVQIDIFIEAVHRGTAGPET
jgi:hypothetical protein